MRVHDDHAFTTASRLTCERDAIHVWRASLLMTGRTVGELSALLSSEERVRAQRYRFARDRDRFFIRHGILRQLLSRYLDLSPQRIEVCYGESGKPFLCGGSWLRFNAASSGDVAVYAVACDREIGVDMERIREFPDLLRLSRAALSPSDAADVITARDPTHRFLEHWTRREATAKQSGRGIFAEDRPVGAPTTVRVWPVDVGSDVVAALAAEDDGTPAGVKSIQLRDWG